MNYLDRTWGDAYEELLTFYPRFYREVFEMDEILRTHGDLLNTAMDDIDRTFINAFIDEADEATIEKWERFLYIGINRQISLDERRRLVKSYLIGSGKISGSLIEEMVKTFTGAESSVDFREFDEERNNALFIEMETDENLTPLMPPLRTLLRKKIPAHIWYIYVQIIREQMDNRGLLDFLVVDINHQIPFDFWQTVKHNGVYLHDGTIYYSAKRRYGFLVGLDNYIRMFEPRERIETNGGEIGVSVNNEVSNILIGLTHHIAVSFYGVFYHNGRLFYNGEALHRVLYKGLNVGLENHIGIKSQTENIKEVSILTFSKETHLHNGAIRYNGEALHKSLYQKEVIA